MCEAEKVTYKSADGETVVHALVWKPDGEPKGLLQIIHGMCEHKERYADFAKFLAERGYIVFAEDHIGHGESVTSDEKLGWMGDKRDFETTLSDIRTLAVMMEKRYPSVPAYIMGHSMGSFFCRVYISRWGEELKGAIVSGTGWQGGGMLSAAKALTHFNALFCGWKHRSKFIKNLAFGGYNKKWNGSGFSWLSVDEENVRRYDEDPLCGFDFTDNGYIVLFSVMGAACSKKAAKGTPKHLPVLFVSGSEDPVGSFGKGVQKSADNFKKAGCERVAVKLYEGARHEVLNDFCKSEAYSDLAKFLEDGRI